MSMELLTYKKTNAAVVSSAEIVAKYAGAQVTISEVAAKDISGAAFLGKSPFGKIPVLSTVSGPIYDGAALLKYIANTRGDLTLTGANLYEKTIVDQWVNIAIAEVPALLETMKGGNDGDKTNALKKILTFFKVVNEHLLYHTFIAGNTFTIADVILAVTLIPAYTSFFGKLAQSTIPNVTRWFLTVVNQPLVASVVGAVELATEDVFIKPEVDTAALAAAPPKPAVKVVNPLDELPKTALKLDDVKRAYCAARPFAPDFFPAFWSTFDAEGYSLWAVEYKYPEDWDKDYVADNQVGGFINRSESARKYAFGVLNIYAEGDHFNAKGAYILRGQTVFDELASVGDYEEYNFVKIDASTAEGKAQFEKLFAAENVDGAEIIYRKQLK